MLLGITLGNFIFVFHSIVNNLKGLSDHRSPALLEKVCGWRKGADVTCLQSCQSYGGSHIPKLKKKSSGAQ